MAERDTLSGAAIGGCTSRAVLILNYSPIVYETGKGRCRQKSPSLVIAAKGGRRQPLDTRMCN